ncbi:pectin acetylesterase-family hydrolase [Microbacterium sp. Root180]|uniref:pectin acetylesterase-family hydrolase n=1 Tax=Microbacterium sp. Root180 TaxID=1736483 RepID=UPI0009EAACCE|nr:pectin acetylesterase-family hydrolase [Microbacterium sp. Root180]
MATVRRSIGRRAARGALLGLVTLAVILSGCSSKPGLEWTRVTPGGDCQCADGSEFAFWEWRADPTRVVIFLNGGGVCWDAATCALTGDHGESDFYDWSIQGTEPENRSGMFDITRGDNPFSEYSFIYVSSCTGDAHLGNVTQDYSSSLTVEHRGYVNGTAALAYLAENYPDATEVIVVGKTAGSVAAPIYGGLVADLLPDATVTVFGAQSGAWPDDQRFNADILEGQWGAYSAMPDWAVAGLGVREWGVPRFWSQAARHDPRLVLARFDFAFDPQAASEVTRWIGAEDSDLLEIIDDNEATIEASGATLHSYTAPGADHQIFEPNKFYDLEVNGVRLVDWLDTLVTADPPADVHCDQCGP